MKGMKKILIFSLVLIGLSFSVEAQDYQAAAGLRLGYPLSASYKTFLNESSAIEGYVGFRSRSGFTQLSITGAYQIHTDLQDVEGLQWYYGGGASVNFANSLTYLGLHGYLGLSYTFEDTPLNLSVDWVPSIFIGGGGVFNGFGGGYGALAARYILNR